MRSSYMISLPAPSSGTRRPAQLMRAAVTSTSLGAVAPVAASVSSRAAAQVSMPCSRATLAMVLSCSRRSLDCMTSRCFCTGSASIACTLDIGNARVLRTSTSSTATGFSSSVKSAPKRRVQVRRRSPASVPISTSWARTPTIASVSGIDGSARYLWPGESLVRPIVTLP